MVELMIDESAGKVSDVAERFFLRCHTNAQTVIKMICTAKITAHTIANWFMLMQAASNNNNQQQRNALLLYACNSITFTGLHSGCVSERKFIVDVNRLNRQVFIVRVVNVELQDRSPLPLAERVLLAV